MHLLKAHGETFNKKEAQKAGEWIFRGKPSQDYLFNFLCGISEKHNGVVRISFQSIATHMSKKFEKTMTVQAVSQLVKKLMKIGAIDYLTIKEEGNRYAVGTFRIAPRRFLLALAGKAKQILEKKIAAAKAQLVAMKKAQEITEEEVTEGEAAITEKKAPMKETTATKTYTKPIKKSDKANLPAWASSDYAYVPKPLSPDKLAELEACISGLR